MKYAWIEDERIRDIAQGDPNELYHPSVAVHYTTEVPDDASPGDGWVDGLLVKPEPVASVPAPEPEPVAITVSPVEFKLLFTSSERVAIKAERAVDPIIDDFYDVIEDPRLTFVSLSLQSTKDCVAYLASKGLIASERVAVILTGEVQ